MILWRCRLRTKMTVEPGSTSTAPPARSGPAARSAAACAGCRISLDRLIPYRVEQPPRTARIVDLSVVDPSDSTPPRGSRPCGRRLAGLPDGVGHPEGAGGHHWVPDRRCVLPLYRGTVLPTIGSKELSRHFRFQLGLGPVITVVIPEMRPIRYRRSDLAGADYAATDSTVRCRTAAMHLSGSISPIQPDGSLPVDHLGWLSPPGP